MVHTLLPTTAVAVAVKDAPGWLPALYVPRGTQCSTCPAAGLSYFQGAGMASDPLFLSCLLQTLSVPSHWGWKGLKGEKVYKHSYSAEHLT